MSIQRLKKENFSGFFRQNSRANLSDERFRQRTQRSVFPLLKPTRNARAEIARPLGEKMFCQLRGAALQVGLADSNYGEQLVALAFAFRVSITAPQSVA